ncbi:ADP-ribosylhydrolase ARH1-like [Dromaius novaehollandiae]|uniref:ADP-ribosylhydrolase ARH1-like n=1 Tax=Dromaius novaehollandiae TaxID=8790 RepID=UPI00311E46F7
MEERVPPVEAYEAAMVLSGVGDALGYRGGLWEYCTSGPRIHAELEALGGLEALCLCPPEWPVSDDTVLHLATAEALATGLEGEALLQELARRYVAAMGDMEGRKPGPTSLLGTSQLRPGEPGGYHIPFNPSGTGCGAAMRSLAIGLRYPRERDLPTLIQVSVDSGRMTHHHPTGYLGAVAVALFGALGARREPPERWGRALLRALPLAWAHVETLPEAPLNRQHWGHFGEAWLQYLESRGLAESDGPARLPPLPDAAARDAAYGAWALGGWAGRSGHDAPMVALEALLAAGDAWAPLCSRAALHGGDSDSTGTIAAGCWGLLHGLGPVPPGLHRHLEHRPRLVAAARRLHALAWAPR